MVTKAPENVLYLRKTENDKTRRNRHEYKNNRPITPADLRPIVDKHCNHIDRVKIYHFIISEEGDARIKNLLEKARRWTMQTFEYKGYGIHPSMCGVSIIDEGNGEKTVVLTELLDNPGTSVTNYVEGIATSVVCELLPNVPVYKIKWVEHYPAESTGDKETFDKVDMEWDGNAFRHVQWASMDKEEVQKIKKQMSK